MDNAYISLTSDIHRHAVHAYIFNPSSTYQGVFVLGHFKHEGIGVRWSMEAEAEDGDWVVTTYVGVYHVAERCRTRPNLTRAVDIAKGLAPALMETIRGNAA